MSRQFTGWHMLAVMMAFFGVIIAVNFTMARIALGSFGGVVVENSYVASQHFNDWLEQARGQEALGWKVDKELRYDRHLVVRVSGVPDPVALTGTARAPLGSDPAVALTFTRTGPGEYVSTRPLGKGRWDVRLQVMGASNIWRSQEELG